ncbi:hypothetical protein FXO37_36589 [Capsicum annuum]|nr:hypothetical protein FXO37_36589 [Capsicum annuum]
MIASFFGLKARACGSLSVPVLERYNLLVRLSMSGSFLSPLPRCGAFHSALSTLYRNAESLTVLLLTPILLHFNWDFSLEAAFFAPFLSDFFDFWLSLMDRIPLSVGGDGSGPSLSKKPSFDLNIPSVEHQVYELMEEEIKRRKAKLAELLEPLIQREAERYPNIRELPSPKAMVERLIESLRSDQIKPKKKTRAMRPILQISKSF